MPTNKETFKSKMDALANSINTKAGTLGAKDLDELKTAVDSIITGGGGAAYPAMTGIESYTYNSTISAVVEYEGGISNGYCVDEDGNSFDGTNGVFQYRIRTNQTWGNWINLSAGSTTINPGSGGHEVEFRFLNTTTNKPFGLLWFQGIPDYVVRLTLTNNKTYYDITPLFSVRNSSTYDTTFIDYYDGGSGRFSEDFFSKTVSSNIYTASWSISGQED